MSSSRLFRKNAAHSFVMPIMATLVRTLIAQIPSWPWVTSIYATHLPSSIMLSDVAPVFIKLFW